MKHIYQICRKASLLCYLFVLYQLWHLCQYGGVRSHLPTLLAGMAGTLISFILWLVFRRKKQGDASSNRIDKKIFWIEIIIFIAGTIYFGGRIIYSAIPYHGALSWVFDERMQKKEIKLEHTNFFEDGAEGVLTDLENVLDLPENLYIANQYKMTFDKEGTIQTIDTFLYGKNEEGETKTYLVNYEAEKNANMTVWVNGEVKDAYEEDMRFEPMLQILKKADCAQQVKEWSVNRDSDRYEILYLGRRSFMVEEGLRYLPGDVDGDGKETGVNHFEQLAYGGEITGFEVSLHIPAREEVTPVRYIMEPQYSSPEVLSEEQEIQQTEDAKEAEGWTVDQTDGTMYFFINETKGWRLVVTDAAAGSRFYEMERTKDGGTTWEKVNADPFQGELGVTEGLVFFDEKLGFAGLTGASQSASELYVTRDGGVTFEQLHLPLKTVKELPELAAECGFTVKDYDYMEMPEKEGNTLTIKVITEASETEGILFQSQDDGETWTYAGIKAD